MTKNWQPPLTPHVSNGEHNRVAFIAEQMLNKRVHCALVEVTSLAGDGTVGVTPLVALQDGGGNLYPHGEIVGVSTWSMQSAAAACSVDATVGDIGIALFFDVDSSVAVKTKKAAAPGSLRRNDWADAIYLGGALNPEPDTFIRVRSGAIDITSTGTISINAPIAAFTGVITASDVIVDGISVKSHTHLENGAGHQTNTMTP